ncbi:MAG TPA: thrombospondin type 3 repeat-containing protein [Kofleriaceae bacterium]
MRALVGLLAVAGSACNWAFDLDETDLIVPSDAAPRPDSDPRVDNDRDGIKDVMDTCIAPDTDLLVDSDGDGMRNEVDPCPTISELASWDADGDGIGDACDPFPTAGDRVRCVMAFTDPELDVLLWRARADATSWELYWPRALIGRAGQAITTDWSFEGPATTTYELFGSIFPVQNGAFVAYARGDVMTNPTDIGCALAFDDGVMSFQMLPSRLSVQIPNGQPDVTLPFRMQLTLEPKASLLRCTIHFAMSNSSYTLTSPVDLPGGNLAFSSDLETRVYGLIIYERDDAPPL